MSKAAREAYFALQGTLNEDRLAAAGAGTGPLEEGIVLALQNASRDLHTALCDDVGSPKPPMIGSAPRE